MSEFVPDELIGKADLYRQRNKLYGDNYKRFGPIMKLLLPMNTIPTDPHTLNRLGILIQIIAKVTRYCQQFDKGGHVDSLDDLSVYSMMLKELDTEPQPLKEE